ncbi:MAG TPA: OmpA family protein [Sphingomicrobium sp.]|jgi:outer membrane protein OmpA-like peptidoglycan-associated protein
MHFRRSSKAVIIGCAIGLVAGCESAAPPPALVRPAAFIPLGLGAAYLSGDLIGGHKSRAAKMRSAKIKALGAGAAANYMGDLDRELRVQTAGIGLDVLRVGNGIVIRIPAALTFDAGSAGVKPQFDATLLEIARTVKSRNQTYVDVFAHTDTTGTEPVNQVLSDKRAAAVASYLGSHGVTKARIASKGLGESAPLYNPDTEESERAANRRVEIRLLPYTG